MIEQVIQCVLVALVELSAIGFAVAVTEEVCRAWAHRQSEEEWRRQYARGMTSRRLHEWTAAPLRQAQDLRPKEGREES
jgi:hypothetical protein